MARRGPEKPFGAGAKDVTIVVASNASPPLLGLPIVLDLISGSVS